MIGIEPFDPKRNLRYAANFNKGTKDQYIINMDNREKLQEMIERERAMPHFRSYQIWDRVEMKVIESGTVASK